MRFDLIRPCASCPFRSDIAAFIHPERAREILGGGRGRAWWPAPAFPCHKTVDYRRSTQGRVTARSQHCAGVLLILTREREPNDMMQLAQRLGLWDPAALDPTAPVYASRAAAIKACERVR